MMPICIGFLHTDGHGLTHASEELLASRGRFGLALFSRLLLLFFGGFGSFAPFHGADKEAREKAATEQSVTEECPGRRVVRIGYSCSQSLDPARQSFGIFGIVQPGSGVSDQIEKDCSEQSTRKKFEPTHAGRKTTS